MHEEMKKINYEELSSLPRKKASYEEFHELEDIELPQVDYSGLLKT